MDLIAGIIFVILFIIIMVFAFSMGILSPLVGRREIVSIIAIGFLLGAIGGYFLKVYSDNRGNIQYFEPEEVLYGQNDMWDEVGKDKRRVKKLEIKQGIY